MRLLAILFILAGSVFAQDTGQVSLLTDEAISRYLSRGQELAKEIFERIEKAGK